MILTANVFVLFFYFYYPLQVECREFAEKQLANPFNSCPTGMTSLYTNVLCSTDYHCQQLTTGFFCYKGKCCSRSMSSSNTGDYGSSCLSNRHCAFKNSRCHNYVCYCRPRFVYNSERNSCQLYYPKSEELEDDLIRDDGVKTKCRRNQLMLDNKCLDLVSYNTLCKHSQQCNFKGGVCLAGRCLCPSGQIYDENGRRPGANECRMMNEPQTEDEQTNDNQGAQKKTEICLDDVQANGISDCPHLRHRCWDPKWRDMLHDLCPVTCGLCVPRSLNDFNRRTFDKFNKRRKSIREKPRHRISSSNKNQNEDIFEKTEGDEAVDVGTDVTNSDKLIEDLARPNLVVGGQSINPNRSNVIFKEDKLVNYPELLQSINRDISPCDNFYHHVCDGFVKNAETDHGKELVDQYSVADKEISGRVYSLLESNRHSRNNLSTLNDRYIPQLYHFYDVCINKSRRDKDGSAFLLNKLISIKNSKTPIQFDTKWMIKAYPRKPFFHFYVDAHKRNTSRKILYFEAAPPPELVSASIFVDDNYSSQLTSYKLYLTKIMSHILADDISGKVFPGRADPFTRKSEIKRRVNNFISIETRRLKIGSRSKSASNTITYMRLSEFQSKYALLVDWKLYFKKFLPKDFTRRNLVESMRVGVFDPAFIKQINTLIGTLKPQEVSDYLDWQILLPFVNGLDDRFLKERERYSGKAIELRRQCKEQALYYFPHHMDRLYANRFFTEEVRLKVLSIVKFVTDAFEKWLQTATWMTTKVKRAALKKAKLLNTHIGYFDDIFDEWSIQRRYRDYKLKRKVSVAEMLWKLDEWQMNYLLRTYSRPPKYYDHSLRVNAEYVRPFNLLFVHAGLVAAAFYKDNLPMSMQIGGLGHMVAHELFRGFDKEGHLYDGYGNEKPWWDSSTKDHFKKSSKCFVRQYSHQKVSINETLFMPLNGVLTLAGNMADNVGISVAYEAMQDSNQQETNSWKVKGLEDYSDAQLFFVNYAFILCDKHTPNGKMQSLEENELAPTPARVNLPLLNSEAFSQAFHCAVGSRMNPRNRKCFI